MDVYVARPDGTDGHIPCNLSTPPDEWWKCGSSNIGGALLQARNEFSSARPSAKWSTILIADGPANRTDHDPRVPWSDSRYGSCPLSERSTLLKCRDGDVNSRHFITSTIDPLYDTDDYAREYGDLLGLNPSLYPSLNSAGIEIFTISFGKSTVCLTGSYTPPSNGQPATCTSSNPGYGDPDAGEQLLRYFADMGDDGNLSTGRCLDTQAPFRDFETRSDPSGRSDDVGLGLSCGNYYFAPDAVSLPTIMLGIAGRIIANDALLPEFNAAPLSGLAPLKITFNNLSTGLYTSTLWTFDDGNTSMMISPTHVYTNPGVYTVTLTIANITTTASLTRTNYIDVSAPQWWIYLPVIQRTS
jgi:PKD domain